MKNDKLKNIFMLIMLIIITILVAYILLTSTNKKNNFLNDVLNLQANLSYYIGQTKSNTFSAYDNIQIITGIAENNEIRNYDDEALKPLVDKDSKLEKEDKVFYKMINENVKEVLKVNISSYSGLEFYIQDGQYLKIKVLSKPSWWNKSFDSLTI